MILDTSAIIAILLNEPSANDLCDTLAASAAPKVSAANALEVSIVVSHKKGDAALTDVDDFYRAADITIVPVSEQHYYLARGAYLRYGKGRHKAALNFGDCFAYALASEMQEPLLCVGDDFSRTDITVA